MVKRKQAHILCSLLLVCVAVRSSTGAAAHPTIGQVDRINAAVNALVPDPAPIEVLAQGFDWSEGPVWVRDPGFLLFTDIPPNQVLRWDPGQTKQVYLTPSGYTGSTPRGGERGANGLLLDSQQRLVLCQHGDRRVARMDAPLTAPRPKFVTLADRYDGKRFNSPNDAVFHSDGSLYFTDPPYGLEQGINDPAKELPFQGVYRLQPNGDVTLLTAELSRPNGIAFSPDESTLYVANSDPQRAIWMAYSVRADGTLEKGRVLRDATDRVGKQKGLPDGMAVDQRGHLFATGPGGVWIISPQGDHLGTIQTTQATSNCTFGEDGRSLFMTADMLLLRIRLTTVGLGF